LDRLERIRAQAANAVAAGEVEAAVLTRDKYRSEVVAREAGVKLAIIQVQEAELLLQLHEVRSPVRGVVRAIYKRPGEAVKKLESVVLIAVKRSVADAGRRATPRAQVRQTYTGSLLFGLGVNSDAGLSGSIILNERNFDVLPGRAFRGAGQEFRLEAVPGTQLQRYAGDFLFLNSLEYQIPIKADDQTFLVGFVDSGTVEGVQENKDYRVSVGNGVRITVPALGPVPIDLDFGFPVEKNASERKQVFQFWTGFYQ
jgi:outer membrane protein assembly factor BamA